MQGEHILMICVGALCLFVIVGFIASCYHITPQHEEWSHKVNNHDYCDYDKAKSLYHKDMMSGVEGSTIVARDEKGIVRYHGKASDYFERFEHGEL